VAVDRARSPKTEWCASHPGNDPSRADQSEVREFATTLPHARAHTVPSNYLECPPQLKLIASTAVRYALIYVEVDPGARQILDVPKGGLYDIGARVQTG
jgi:hypothetical protein